MRTGLYFVLLHAVCGALYSQGLLNNGAQVQLTSGVTVYVKGANGHYTSQGNGAITNITPGGTLTVEGNWYNNAANAAFTNDGATTVLGSTSQTIGGTTATAFYNLNLLGTGTKSLAVTSVTVGGQTNQTGVLSLGTCPLDLNSKRLDVTNSAITAITNTSGYIISETNTAVNPSIVRWRMGTTTGAHKIPFGVAGSIIPFTFNITSAMSATTAYVDVSTRATGNSDNTPWAGASNVAAVSNMFDQTLGIDGSVDAVIDRWWNITPSDPVTADVTFSYRGSENTLTGAYQTGGLGAQHWTGSLWEAPVGLAMAVTTGTGAVTAPGLSSFSPYVLSAIAAPLPIELLTFEYTCQNNAPLLSWCTATETNNHHFSIQHSVDGFNYTTIATIPGSGTSSVKNCYRYPLTEATDLSQLHYFKLSQTDFNGTTKTFHPITSQPCNGPDDRITITSDGSKDVMVEINASTQSYYELRLLNGLGETLLTFPLMAAEGQNKFPLHLSNLANALYYASVLNTTTGKLVTKKIILAN